MLQGPERTIRQSRALRKEMSLPERMLWRVLRSRPGGLRFRGQHPAGPYTADFFCHEVRLVIEIDGEAHGCKERVERDERRDAWFAERGFNVMRIPAEEVLKDAAVTAEGILARSGRSVAQKLTPRCQASPDTSPTGGGPSAWEGSKE